MMNAYFFAQNLRNRFNEWQNLQGVIIKLVNASQKTFANEVVV